MANSTEHKFRAFLSKLGYSALVAADKHVRQSFYYYLRSSGDDSTDHRIAVEYHYFPTNDALFYKHLSLWNENRRTSFVAIFDDKVHIIDTRHKPDADHPLSNKIIIKSFDYGINTVGYDFDTELQIISKAGVDSSYYFDLVVDHQRRKKAYEVDKDLLLNLLALRNDLVTKQNEQIIHLLLLRCLFVKYLEDREVFEKDFLHKTLSKDSPEKLISAFRKVRKINGDLFNNNELQAADIQPRYLKRLSEFFGYSDYRSRQGKLFPYQFNRIPIQLISSIYESFLKEEAKKYSGVYYTPSFLVNFILSQTLRYKLEADKNVTVLDPACGSGAFLVEAFRMLVKANNAERDYEKKKKLLQTKLFGVDLDTRALQIAAFSLYLALLEGEDPAFIQEKIRLESPILPSLLGKSLIKRNALVDQIQFEVDGKMEVKTFDCIIANPPWGSVPDDHDAENIRTRDAMESKGKAGGIAEYRSVSDFQRSQAFLLRSAEWSHDGTIISMVVNNSVFLNENAESFRKEFLQKFQLTKFFELSDINKILFKKHRIGEIKGVPVEIGANEPCCVLIYSNGSSSSHTLKYISPKLNRFNENLRLITYSSKEALQVKQADLIKDDLLWRIFVNGGWSEYQLIKKQIISKPTNVQIECRSGFQPKVNMKATGKSDWRKLIKPSDFSRYVIKTPKLDLFNWSQTLRRKPSDSIFEGERILIAVRPLVSDELRFRAIKVAELCVHTDNLLSIKIKKNGQYIDDYRPYLAVFNSKFLGFYFYNLSSQWGKGEAKRSTLRNSDIEKFPMPDISLSDPKVKKLCSIVTDIENLKESGGDSAALEEKADEIVYDLYNLTQYEKAVVNDFFKVFHYRKGTMVTTVDLENYAAAFKSIFQLFLDKEYTISFTMDKSLNLGAAVCFTIHSAKEDASPASAFNILSIVKKVQLKATYFTSLLAEEKVKYYDKENNRFYIVKSNLFKDWTTRLAIDDANEEIGDIIKHLKSR